MRGARLTVVLPRKGRFDYWDKSDGRGKGFIRRRSSKRRDALNSHSCDGSQQIVVDLERRSGRANLTHQSSRLLMRDVLFVTDRKVQCDSREVRVVVRIPIDHAMPSLHEPLHFGFVLRFALK